MHASFDCNLFFFFFTYQYGKREEKWKTKGEKIVSDCGEGDREMNRKDKRNRNEWEKGLRVFGGTYSHCFCSFGSMELSALNDWRRRLNPAGVKKISPNSNQAAMARKIKMNGIAESFISYLVFCISYICINLTNKHSVTILLWIFRFVFWSTFSISLDYEYFI